MAEVFWSLIRCGIFGFMVATLHTHPDKARPWMFYPVLVSFGIYCYLSGRTDERDG